MSLPRQTVGLTNFSGLSSCPPNPNAIRAIVFTKCDNLSVVNGASTEIQLSLTNFFVPVDNAAKISFTVPKKVEDVPYALDLLDLGGVDVEGEVKFISLFPQYGTTASGNKMYLEWATRDSIDNGELLVKDPLIQTGNTSFDFSNINSLQFSWGGCLSYTGGTGSLYAATDGGLIKWDGSSMRLWNTLNSDVPTDYMNSLAIDSSNTKWIASNAGVIQFNEASVITTKIFNSENSFIPSDIINDIRLFDDNRVVVGTNNGISIFDTAGVTFSNYNIYNSPLLKHNIINNIVVSDDLILFVGTTGGVYVFDYTSSAWNLFPMNSSSVIGWGANDDVQSLAVHDEKLYVATTTGMIVIPYLGITGASSSPIIGITASTVVSSPTGPTSSNFHSLRIENYRNVGYELYVGHGDIGGISYFNILDEEWFTTTVDGLTSGPVVDVLPDFLSGSISHTLFSGNNAGSGIYKTYTAPIFSDKVPGIGNNVNILMSIPTGLSSGQYSVDNSQLFSIEQPIYFLMSKDMTNGATSGIPFEGFVSLNNNLSGSGATVTGSWSWSVDGKFGTFLPSSLNRASAYNLSVALGSTSADGSFVMEGRNIGFYTEDIDPVLGWETMGKMLVLSGSDTKYIDSIYIRNPQFTDVNVIAIIGK